MPAVATRSRKSKPARPAKVTVPPEAPRNPDRCSAVSSIIADLARLDDGTLQRLAGIVRNNLEGRERDEQTDPPRSRYALPIDMLASMDAVKRAKAMLEGASAVVTRFSEESDDIPAGVACALDNIIDLALDDLGGAIPRMQENRREVYLMISGAPIPEQDVPTVEEEAAELRRNGGAK